MLIAAFILFFFKRAQFSASLTIASFGLLIGGGISNYIDRIFRGGVLDFIDLGFWPSFNLADASITASAFLLIIFHDKIFISHGSK